VASTRGVGRLVTASGRGGGSGVALRVAGHESRRRGFGSQVTAAASGLRARLMLGPRHRGRLSPAGARGACLAESGPLPTEVGPASIGMETGPDHNGATPAGGESGGRHTVRLRGGQSRARHPAKPMRIKAKLPTSHAQKAPITALNPMLPDVGPLRREFEGKLFVHSLTWARGPSRPRPAAPGGPRPTDSASAILGRRRPGFAARRPMAAGDARHPPGAGTPQSEAAAGRPDAASRDAQTATRKPRCASRDARSEAAMTKPRRAIRGRDDQAATRDQRPR
jgi:hypothetical protein